MSRYDVVWVESASDDLARFWLRATDQQVISEAADLADQVLATDPVSQSDALSEGLRAITSGSLRIFFVIYEDDRKVEVLYVKRIVRQ
jgi:hypothetical protein